MTTPADLPRAVTAFLKEHVQSFATLRFLLAMHSAPGGTTTLTLVARALALPKQEVLDVANEAANQGLIRVNSEHLELAPISIEDRLALADLAHWYGREREVVLAALRALGRDAP
jgi:hypothetical protein